MKPPTRQELDSEYKAILKAVEIMLSGKPGAAANVVREDYPELAELIDARQAMIAASK